MCITQRNTTSCRTAMSESYELLIIVVVVSDESILDEDEGTSSGELPSLASRFAASSENMMAVVDGLSLPPSLECRPATASYRLTECPTSRNLRAVSASKEIFCAKATLTIRDESVIRCATFLKTYRGKIEASEGGNVVTTENKRNDQH